MAWIAAALFSSELRFISISCPRDPGSSSTSGGGGVGALSFVASSVIANVLGIVAWLSFTRLGETEGASDFTPIVALYVYVPVLLSGVLLGESFAQPLKIAGLACAGAASVLLSIK